MVGGTTSVEVDDKLFAPALRMLPAELTDGATWSARSQVTHTSNVDGEVSTEVFEVANEALARRPVTVGTPAGTFEAWAVTTTEDGETFISYWAEGIGRVADVVDGTPAGHLVAYE